MTSVAMKIVNVKAPSTGRVKFQRIVLAHLNKAAYCYDFQSGTGDYVQSFAPKYRICESGDYKQVTPEILEKYMARVMEWHKIDHIIPHG